MSDYNQNNNYNQGQEMQYQNFQDNQNQTPYQQNNIPPQNDYPTQPLMDRLGVLGTVRASFSFYNTKEEIDSIFAGIMRISKMF